MAQFFSLLFIENTVEFKKKDVASEPAAGSGK